MDLRKGLRSIGILTKPPDEAPAPPPISGPAGSTATMPSPMLSMGTGQVDPSMLEHMRSDVDKAATPGYHAFMQRMRELDGEGLDQLKQARLALKTCGFPKNEILQGIQSRSAALETLQATFNRDVESTRQSQLGSKDTAIKQIEGQLAERQSQREKQIALLQQQIDQLRTSTEAEVARLTADKTRLQSERTTLEQQLNVSVTSFTATAAQLRSELAKQSADYSVALSS